VEWNGMEWNGMEWNGMEWNQVKYNEVNKSRKKRKMTPLLENLGTGLQNWVCFWFRAKEEQSWLPVVPAF
jgi:hypothetical protein